MKTINTLVCILFIFLLFSCGNDDFGNTIPESEIIGEQDDVSFQATHFGDPFIVDFTGRITDVSGNGILGARISIGNTITETDTNGVFVIEDATAFENFAFVKVSKDGYIPGSRALIPDLNTANDIQITLLEKNIVTTIQAGESSIATLGESSVSFTGDFIDENNNPYTGEVEVSLHYLRPNQRETFEQMPGMLFAQDINNEARSLETYGMLAVNLFSPSGDVLNIAEDSPATIEFPVNNTQIGIAPESIPLWFFDENVGYWKQQGEALKIGNKYIGEVTHFTWWNCDLPIRYIEACITIQDENGGIAATPIQIIRNETGQIIFEGIVNQNGNECGLFPTEEEVTLKVFGTDACADEQIYEAQLGPYSTDTVIVVTIPTAVIDQTTLTGTVANCDGMPLDHGIGLLVDDSGQVTGIPFTIENGVLDYTFTYCAETSYNVIIIDQNQNQSTGLLPLSITSDVTNLGGLSTCEQQGGVFDGDVVLSNQFEIDAFGLLGYNEITGNFSIFVGYQQEITSFAPLHSLQIIGGDFYLGVLPDIESLQGLGNITSVSGTLQISYLGEHVTSLETLSSISSEVQGIEIINSIQLESLSGLENIQIANGGDLILEGNDNLINLDALNGNLPEIMGTFRLSPRFPGCTSCTGFPPVFQQFTDLSFLSTVQQIHFLRLRGFQGESFQGIQNIHTADRITVWDCPNITDLSYMSNISGNVDRLFVLTNVQLTSLEGLEQVTTIPLTLNISGNDILTNFCSLTNSLSNQIPEDIFLDYNGFNPTIQDIINGNCSE